jgi:protein TonB
MSYLTKPHANRPAAIIGVAGIHIGLGALVVLGLTVGGTLQETYSGPLPAREFPNPPPPPPPEAAEQPKQSTNSVVFTPPVPDIFPPKPSIFETTPILPPLTDDLELTVEKTLPNIGTGPGIAPKPFKPEQVRPRNDPSSWLTDNDYRTNWIRKEMYGTASFALSIGTNGRVENCSITKSTGHAALDDATCKLVAKRARFTPAKNGLGEPVQGSFSSSIRWVLPD